MMLTALVLAPVLRIREAPRLPDAAPAPPLLGVLRQAGGDRLLPVGALMVAAHTSLYAFYSLYLEQAGYSKPVIGAMWSLGVLAEVVFFYFQVFACWGASARASDDGWRSAVAVLRFAAIGFGAGRTWWCWWPRSCCMR
jgi:PPP family 3-phenylpropionic acid transporter